MNTILWIFQALVAAAFLYSGIQKSIYSEQQLVARGQTGVEGLSAGLIRFIGISEIVGAVGIILPVLLHTLIILTPVAAGCFAIIMILAGIIHYRRHEPKNVLNNAILFCMCIFILYGRTR